MTPMPRAAVYEATFGGDGFKLQSFKPYATGLRNSMALTVLSDGPAKGTVLQGENSIDYDAADQPPEQPFRRLRQDPCPYPTAG